MANTTQKLTWMQVGRPDTVNPYCHRFHVLHMLTISVRVQGLRPLRKYAWAQRERGGYPAWNINPVHSRHLGDCLKKTVVCLESEMRYTCWWTAKYLFHPELECNATTTVIFFNYFMGTLWRKNKHDLNCSLVFTASFDWKIKGDCFPIQIFCGVCL